MKQRILLLALAALLTAFVSACSASPVNNPGSDQPTIALHTPLANLTPTPTAPPFSIGAFSTSPTPNVNDSLTIYVIFHLNDGATSRGVGGASVNLYFHTYYGNSIIQLNSLVGTQQTTPDGWAAFPITYTGLPNQTPVLVDVTVVYNGQTYSKRNAAFFTPVQVSPTPSPTTGG